MIDPARIRAVSFDCYGTLVDWQAGIHAFVAPLLARAMPSRHEQSEARPQVSPQAWVERWEKIQFQMLRPYRPYREILQRSFDATMQHFGLEAFVDEGPGLARAFAGRDRASARRRRAGLS